jgi:NAD(P)-dependent dehydrogenase (short-subunit alcohol dehydrogenase family)
LTWTHPSLRGRVALVTGGSRGLGREMALALAAAGCRVAILGSAETPELAGALKDALAFGGEALAVTGDVSDFGACAAAVELIMARFGRIDVLVNNAGRGMRLASETFTTQPVKFWELDPAIWRRIIDINVTGAFNMARAVAPGMVDRGFGRIVNISTSAQTMVRRGYAPYGPSKSALEAASRVWAQDLAGTGVTVNVLLPGGAANTELLPGGPNRRGADGNLLDPAIMRAPMVWLASDASSGHTGERYIARLWDENLSVEDATAKARSAPVSEPAII